MPNASLLCALVGFGPGMGAGLARAFGGDGFALALLSRSPDHSAQALAELQNQGFCAQAFACDAGQTDAVAGAFAQVRAHMGEVQVLIYNAAAFHGGPLSQIDAPTLDDDFRVNVSGALACAREVLPAMRARGAGTLLFTGGAAAFHPTAQSGALSLTKAALRNLALSLADELEPQGIHAATVTIGGAVQAGTHFDPDLIAAQYLRLHLQRRGQWQREVVYQ